MDSTQVNQALAEGALDTPGLFPHLEDLAKSPFVFRTEFGLDALPDEPGLVLVRGARQFGKSTWLEQQVRDTAARHGPATAYLLNGDELRDEDALLASVRGLAPLYRSGAPVRRLFIDEITAIRNWQRGLKRLLDAGELRDVLVVTTGSRATDLRRGSERLPGRKGKLARTSYLFTPVSYPEFSRVCGRHLGPDTWPAYMLSGGCPVACSELGAGRRIPEYVIEMTRDWIYGEFAAAGRARPSLLGVMDCLHRFGGAPVGQAKLAREAGLANNTVAAGYIEQLMDLLAVAQAFAWDEARRRTNRRRPCKYHFTNLLVAVAWHPSRLRSTADYAALPAEQQARMVEWAVAQELWRRAAIRGDEMPELLHFWQSESHELDFVVSPEAFLEVKRGTVSPTEFSWWLQTFRTGQLTVLSQTRFDTDRIRGVTVEDFLAGG